MKPDDVWSDELRGRCAKAIADYLQKSVNLQRPIGSLSRAEMLGMAEAATAEWIRSVSQKLQEVQIIGDAELDKRNAEHADLLFGG